MTMHNFCVLRDKESKHKHNNNNKNTNINFFLGNIKIKCLIYIYRQCKHFLGTRLIMSCHWLMSLFCEPTFNLVCIILYERGRKIPYSFSIILSQNFGHHQLLYATQTYCMIVSFVNQKQSLDQVENFVFYILFTQLGVEVLNHSLMTLELIDNR